MKYTVEKFEVVWVFGKNARGIILFSNLRKRSFMDVDVHCTRAPKAVYIVLLAANMLGQHAGPTMLAQQNVGPTKCWPNKIFKIENNHQNSLKTA